MLKVIGLSKRLGSFRLQPLSFQLEEGEVLGVLGESGSGKTTLFNLLLGLLLPDSGKITVDGRDIHSAGRKTKARLIQGIFQNPSQSLDPARSVHFLMAEPFLIHRLPHSRSLLEQLLAQVGLPAQVLDMMPSQLSGGQLQRLAIARALALNPKVLVADEPLSALDPSVQNQILKLLQDLKKRQLTMVFISHEAEPVFFLADRIMVMLKGWVMEFAPAEQLLHSPSNPYTSFLLNPYPVEEGKESTGCPFAPFCRKASELCFRKIPPLRQLSPEHFSRCHLL